MKLKFALVAALTGLATLSIQGAAPNLPKTGLAANAPAITDIWA